MALISTGVLLISLVLFFILIKQPIWLMLISVFVSPLSYYYTQTDQILNSKGMGFSYISTLLFWLLNIWVYEYFEWPPNLWDVLLLFTLCILAVETLFTFSNYLFQKNKLSIYLQQEVFFLKIIQVCIALLYYFAGEHIYSFKISFIMSLVLMIGVYILILKEISRLGHQ